MSLLDYLCCPVCHSALEVEAEAEANGEIREGLLRCADGCGFTTPVIRFVPRFVDRANYSHSWGKLWEEAGGILRDSFTGIPFHRNAIHGRYDESGEAKSGTSPFGFEWPADMRGEKVLEIGPGTGNCTEVLVETGAEIVSVDMSHAIDTFPEELTCRPNLHVVQGDVTAGFLKQGLYDRVWLFQVLQHTPEPSETLAFVRPFLREGGELAVTSYVGHYDPWYYKHTKRVDDLRAWRLLVALTPPLVRVKYALQRLGDLMGSPKLRGKFRNLLGFIDPRNIYYRTLRGQMNDWLMGAAWTRDHDKRLLMEYVIINTYDCVTPTYTNNCPDLATMERWLAEAGYTNSKVWGAGGVRARGWN